jgi:hypothetical protein
MRNAIRGRQSVGRRSRISGLRTIVVTAAVILTAGWCSVALGQWYDTYDFESAGVQTYCPFEDSVSDVTGNGNNPTNSGVAITGGGRLGNCAEVELGDYLQYVTLDFGSNPATWAFWYRPRTIFPRGGMLLSYDESIAGNYVALGNDMDDPRIFAQVAPDPSSQLISTTEGEVDQWMHITLVITTARIELYINGHLEDSGPGKPDRTLGSPYLGNTQIVLFWGSEVDGDFDDFLFFDRGLLAQEIAQLARDTDSDAIADFFDDDDDDDGLPDSVETETGVFINQDDTGTHPADRDTDDDALSDGDEVYTYGTDPNNPDTDGDGMNDGHEVAFGYNPLDPGSWAEVPGITAIGFAMVVMCLGVWTYMSRRLKHERA